MNPYYKIILSDVKQRFLKQRLQLLTIIIIEVLISYKIKGILSIYKIL